MCYNNQIKKSCYLIVLAVVMLSACQKDNLTEFSDRDITAEQPAIQQTLSKEDAVAQAIGFVSDMNATASTRSVLNKEVSSVYAWRSSEIYGERMTTRNSTNLPDTMLYIVNFGDEEGYALVSADADDQGVVAYIERGSLTPNDSIDNPGFKIFLEGMKNMRSSCIQTSRFDFPPLPPMVNVPPLLETKWHQHAPYNKYCFTLNGQQAVAGCVAIAVGQICAYHQRPSSYNGHVYNWNSILANEYVSISDTVASNSVGHLIHDIGVLVDMTYGINLSYASSLFVVNCWGNFGYSYNWDTDMTLNDIAESLQDEDPVYIQGLYYDENEVYSHAWVIDGMQLLAVQGYQVGGENPKPVLRNFVHCNWGWGGSNDGFFVYGAFEKKYNSSTMHIDTGYPPYNDSNYGYWGVE